jgi:hypothetical protein
MAEKKELSVQEIAAKKLKEDIAKDVKAGFLSPFKKGVNYSMFLEAVGKKTVAEYCKSKLTDSQIEWLENDIKKVKK